MNKKLDALLKLTKEFQAHNIRYGIGGSLLLYLLGMNVTVEDIDIIVDQKDHQQVKEIIKPYIVEVQKQDTNYKTDYFYELQVDEIDFDIMVNFKIQKEDLFTFNLRDLQPANINNNVVYLSSLTQWLEAYKLMGRTSKVEIIETYLEEQND